MSRVQRVLLARGMGCRIYFRMEFVHLVISLTFFVNSNNIPSLLSTVVHVILIDLQRRRPFFCSPDRSLSNSICFGSMWGSFVIPRQIFASLCELYQSVRKCFKPVWKILLSVSRSCRRSVSQCCVCIASVTCVDSNSRYDNRYNMSRLAIHDFAIWGQCD